MAGPKGRRARGAWLWLALLALAWGSASAQAPSGPRAASLNVCTDQMLMLLAGPGQIASVTPLARDARVSAMAEAARDLPLNGGGAEAVIAQDPDLVLAGTFTARPTVRLLQALGYEVVEFAPEAGLADIRANLRRMGAALAREGRAEDLIAQMDAALAEAAPPPGAPRPVYADIGVGGEIPGSQTLAADLARAAGLTPLSESLGFSASRALPLEVLLTAEADVVSLDSAYDGPALAAEALRHPALRAFAASRTRVDIPDRLWSCGLPGPAAEAVRRLAAARAEALARMGAER